MTGCEIHGSPGKNLRGAIAQLELAKQGGGDDYQLSAIESELRKLRETEAAHAKRN